MSDQKITVSWDDIKKQDLPVNVIIGNEPIDKKKRGGKIAAIGVCCLLAIGIGAFCLRPSYDKPILEVLKKDHWIGQDAQNDPSPKRAVMVLVDRMRNIDLSACPEDFSITYRRHTNAWAKMPSLIERAEQLTGWENVATSILAGFIGGFTGNPGIVIGNILDNLDASDELTQQAEAVEAEIKSSFDDVKECARRYGVDTSAF